MGRPGSAAGRDMAETAQRPPEIARQSPDIGTFAAFGLENRMIGVGRLDQLEGVDFHWPGLQRHRLTLPRDVIGALAGDLDGGKLRRHLRIMPV